MDTAKIAIPRGEVPTFEAPGPGVWQRDEDHWPRPVPASYAEIYPEATVPYVREWTSRYGLLLDYFETAFVDGFGYARMHAVGEPGDGGSSGPPPKPVFWLLSRLHPALRERRAAARRAIEQRLWLDDLEEWEQEAKPQIVADNRANAAVDRAALDDDALLAHVDECREDLRRFIGIHHRYNGGMLPIGLLLVAMEEWTGDSAPVLDLLEGASPVSSGRSEHLRRLAEAIRDDAELSGALDGEPEDVLRRLETGDGRVGAAYREYLETVGYRLVGDSIEHGNPTLVEVPALMVRTIRSAVEGSEEPDQHRVRERAAAVRATVPQEHRHRFDELLDDTLATYRMRDERSVYADVWAAGIFRQALLELGRRLAGRDRLAEPVHLIEATSDEVTALATGNGGPAAEELARRAEFRETHADHDAPASLGGEPSDPPPIEVLPSGLREANMAIFAQISGFLGREGDRTDGGVLRGRAASPGRYEGTARVVIGPSELDRIEHGDVLVARTTSEAFNVALPLLGAIVTNRGGPLSHAAIVAREAGIPCVVATGEATAEIPDGATVVVDGSEGEVVIR
ncbi:MAG: PEP-utilizing enzyme [Nitriliruptorales bacterium]|nr:PEP-utilizing enzyme [Nitriliruptorales bacterium]